MSIMGDNFVSPNYYDYNDFHNMLGMNPHNHADLHGGHH